MSSQLLPSHMSLHCHILAISQMIHDFITNDYITKSRKIFSLLSVSYGKRKRKRRNRCDAKNRWKSKQEIKIEKKKFNEKSLEIL